MFFSHRITKIYSLKLLKFKFEYLELDSELHICNLLFMGHFFPLPQSAKQERNDLNNYFLGLDVAFNF